MNKSVENRSSNGLIDKKQTSIIKIDFPFPG